MRIERGLFEGHFLQRQMGGASASLSGKCAEEGPVIVTVRTGKTILSGYREMEIGLARGGRFQAVLRGLPAGGPYTVTLVCGKDAVQVQDVFVGDLWLMAGQSNMEGCAILGGTPEPHPQVRCFTMARRWEMARDPLHLKQESPDPVHGGEGLTAAEAGRLRHRAERGGGVGIHFGRLMLEMTGVPQGLIATARGGSTLRQWDPALKRLGGSSLYGSMWLSLSAIDQPLAGVLWSQGESEALPDLARVYTRSMRRLIASLRRDLGQPELPWLVVQIGRFIKGGAFAGEEWPDPVSWNRVQEQQRRLPDVIPGCAVVPSVDLGLDDLVHLGGDAFPILASRLAEVAARVVYREKNAGREINPSAIRLHAARPPQGPQIHVDFTGVTGDLHGVGDIRGFSLLGPGGRPIEGIHRVSIRRRRVVLHLTDAPPRGTRLAYGHGLDPSCYLMDGRGMAVPVFGPLAIAGLAGHPTGGSGAAPVLGDLPTHT